MSFSSPAFLFLFIPLFFPLYFCCPARFKNALLFVASFAFYSIDGGYVSGVLLASVVLNYWIGTTIGDQTVRWQRISLLWVGIALNLLPLLYYKYWNFILVSAHDALMPAGIQIMLAPNSIILPAGISFFTFQGLSYLVDIYRNEVLPARSMVAFGMYHTLFPQLIAGPIVRYEEVEKQIYARPFTISNVESGILRFCFGLAKKIILADSMGAVADKIFGLSPDQLTTSAAWLGALTYTLQIYFDFSGYSDMAIGLGLMLGFNFPENFNLPYRSRSITEFWRRWHMTLSRWFRDYLYIPIGGNRSGAARTYLNLWVVFLLCGLWHGAAYTFLVWGCYHGFLLVIERISSIKSSLGWRCQGALRWAITMLLVIIGWVIFRSATLQQTHFFLKAMSGFAENTSEFDAAGLCTPDKIIFFCTGVIIAMAPLESFPSVIKNYPILRPFELGLGIVLFLYSSIIIAADGFNPFIYFRF